MTCDHKDCPRIGLPMPRVAQSTVLTHSLQITDDMVERAARAMNPPAFEEDEFGNYERDPKYRREAKKEARAILIAALAPGNGAVEAEETSVLPSSTIAYWFMDNHDCDKLSHSDLVDLIDRARIDGRKIEAAQKSAPQVRTSQHAEQQPQGDPAGCGADTAALDLVTVEAILNHHFYTGEPGQHGAIKAATAALLAPSRVSSTNRALTPDEDRLMHKALRDSSNLIEELPEPSK